MATFRRAAIPLPVAGVVELVDALDSKSSSERSAGSTPATRTTYEVEQSPPDRLWTVGDRGMPSLIGHLILSEPSGFWRTASLPDLKPPVPDLLEVDFDRVYLIGRAVDDLGIVDIEKN